MSLFFSLSLFFLSFAPLWVSVIFIDSKSIYENTNNIYVESISIIVIMLCAIISYGILKAELNKKSKEGTTFHVLQKVEEQKTITSEYLLSYILPLFTFDFKTWYGVILFLIFFLTLGFLCIRHNHFSVNIVLEVLDYRYYKCTLENDDGIVSVQSVISRRHLTAYVGENIYLKSLNNEYKLDVE